MVVVGFTEIGLLEEDVVLLLAAETPLVQDVLEEVVAFLDAGAYAEASRAMMVVTAVGGQLLVVVVLATRLAHSPPDKTNRAYLVLNAVTPLAVAVKVPTVILSVTEITLVGTVSIMLVTSCVDVLLKTPVTVTVGRPRSVEQYAVADGARRSLSTTSPTIAHSGLPVDCAWIEENKASGMNERVRGIITIRIRIRIRKDYVVLNAFPIESNGRAKERDKERILAQS